MLFLGCALVFTATIFSINRAEALQIARDAAANAKNNQSNVDWDAPVNDKTDGDTNSDSNGEEPDKLSTPREQFDYFMNSFNNVKTEAKSVKKYWKRESNYNNVAEAPAGLSSTLGGLLRDNLKEEEPENEEYTGEDIVKYFPPEGAKSNFTTDNIKDFSFKEDDEYYYVTIVCKDEVNPKAGIGIGAIASVLTREQITDPISSVPFLNGLDPICSYENVTCEAKIEKATGHLVHYSTDAPMYLTFDQLNARVGLEFEDKWEITY